MKYLTQLIRILVGLTFVFSGFVKLVDPLGTSYKFQEYFGADVLNLEFLIPYALPFSIFLIVAEFMLGVMLLAGFKSKLTVWGLAVMIILFLFLTWYSAYFDKVTDCGCFGDALKLSPWGTLYKNVVLVVMILFLLARVKDIKAVHSKTVAKWISFIALFFALYISYYVLKHLPLIDFRPYAIGKNIPQGMTIPEDAKQPVYEDTWIYKVDGKDREYTTEEKPWTIEGATFVDRKTKLIEKGFEPSIHDFTMEKDGMDLTGRLMEKSRLMLIVMYDISKTDTALLPKVKELSERAMQDGYEVYAFSASSAEDFEAIKKEYGLDIDLLFCDETTLKTIIRANPGIVTLDKGTITGKWNATDADKVKL